MRKTTPKAVAKQLLAVLENTPASRNARDDFWNIWLTRRLGLSLYGPERKTTPSFVLWVDFEAKMCSDWKSHFLLPYSDPAPDLQEIKDLLGRILQAK